MPSLGYMAGSRFSGSCIEQNAHAGLGFET